MEAAINEAAYRVLKGLFPSRGAVYEAAYTSGLAAIANGDAKSRGMALGAEVAAGVLAQRANDGRLGVLALPAYVHGTAPGEFRGLNTAVDPVGRQNPLIRPFALLSVGQFRPEPPPALTSELYARDLNETKAIGGEISALRTAEQLDIARFHTDSPAVGQYRNQRRFATANANLADNARVLAILSVATADAGLGCFEAKYHYNFWRPQFAIPQADADGNPATDADPLWKPVVTTPNHPEYPSGHGCGTGATVEALRQFYGTKKISFIWDTAVATVVEKTRHYESTDELDTRGDRRARARRHALSQRQRCRRAFGPQDCAVGDAPSLPAELRRGGAAVARPSGCTAATPHTMRGPAPLGEAPLKRVH